MFNFGLTKLPYGTLSKSPGSPEYCDARRRIRRFAVMIGVQREPEHEGSILRGAVRFAHLDRRHGRSDCYTHNWLVLVQKRVTLDFKIAHATVQVECKGCSHYETHV